MAWLLIKAVSPPSLMPLNTRYVWLQKIGRSSASKVNFLLIKVVGNWSSQIFCCQKKLLLIQNSTGSSASKSFATEDRPIFCCQKRKFINKRYYWIFCLQKKSFSKIPHVDHTAPPMVKSVNIFCNNRFCGLQMVQFECPKVIHPIVLINFRGQFWTALFTGCRKREMLHVAC